MKTLNKAAGGLLVLALLCASFAGAGVNSYTRTGTDGGLTTAIAVQPTSPNVVLAATRRGIYRSTNGGTSWTLASTPANSITRILFDPVVPNRVFAVGSRVIRSDNAGATWTAAFDLPGNMGSIAVSGSRMYASALMGNLWRSENSGLNWTAITVPWSTTTPSLYGIAADPNNDEVLYACVPNVGMYKTIDHGDNWIPPPVGSACEDGFGWTISVNPFDSDEVIAATSDGLFLSGTGGGSWTAIFSAPIFDWAVFDPHVAGRVFGMDSGGLVMRSTDGGLTWPGASNGANLKLYRPAGAAFTATANQLYLATPDGPMYSTDNGSTFALRVDGIEASDVAEVISADDGTIYALQHHGRSGVWRRAANSWTALDNAELLTHVPGWFDFHGIATSASDSSLLYISDESVGPIRSNNGGSDWVGPPASFQTQSFGVAVDPGNPLIAYAVPAAGGLRRTIDGGLNWTNCGLAPGLHFQVFRVDRASPNIIYAVGEAPPNNQVYKSSNSCGSWAPVSGSFTLPTTDLAIDPADHNRIYVAGYDGLQRSTNAGGNWTPVDVGLAPGTNPFVYRVLVDPVRPSTLWILTGGAQSGFGRSVDDGATWQWAAPPAGMQPEFKAGVLDPLKPDTAVIGASSWGLVEYQVAPDLRVTIEPAADSTPANLSSPWIIHAENLGPWDSSAAEVTINLPPGVTVPAPPAGCANATLSLRCELTRLRVNEVRDIEVTFSLPDTVGIAQAEVLVEGHETDPVSSNDTVHADIDIRQLVDLAIAAPASVSVDRTQEATLQVTASNTGASTANNARVVFSVWGAVQPVSATTPVGSCASSSGGITCTLGNVAPGASHQLELRFTGTLSGGTSIETSFISDGVDTNGDQQASTFVFVNEYFDLSTQLAVSSAAKQAGVPFQITATVRVDGDDSITPEVAISLSGATASAAVTSQGRTCSINGAAISCLMSDMGYGGTATIQITATTAAPGSVSVTATSSVHEGTDTNTANNTATLSTTVGAAPPAGGGAAAGSKKGGGGSFDWLALGLLGLIARRRFSGAA